MFNNVVVALAHQPGVVTLSGQIIIHNSGGGGATAGIRFTDTGLVQEREGAAWVTIDSLTDWINPKSFASMSYDVRYTNLTGNDFTTRAANEDVWVNLGTTREWLLQESGGGIAGNNCDFEIRLDTTTLASTLYQFTADDT